MVDFREVPAGRIDPHVKLPTSVQNASAAIERFYEAQKANGGTPPAEAPVAPPAPPAEPVTPPEAPMVPPPPVQEPVQPPAPVADATPPDADGTPPEAPTDDTPVPSNEQIQADPWANRYNAMRGRLGAETKKFNTAMAQKDREIHELHSRLSQLSDEVVKSNQLLTSINARQHATPPQPKAPLITTDDLEKHGADTIDFVKRAAREAVGQEIETLAERNARLEQELSRSRKQAMNAELTRLVPSWRQVNTDPRFLNWLRQPNIYTGQTNKELLDAAARSADAQRVAAFFNGFLAEEKATGQRDDTNNPAPPPKPAPRVPAVDLKSLAAPGSGKPAGGTDLSLPPSKPIYKTSDFERVRRDKAAGRYTAQQIAAIEADMHRATLEGRIIKG